METDAKQEDDLFQSEGSGRGRAGVYADLHQLVALEYEARGFSFLPRQPIHSILAGRHASRLRGRGLNFEEIRRYLPGDDVRQIDWKVTARTRKTHTRIYTEERERSILVLVDQRRTMFFGTIRNMKSVTAAEAAALATWRTLGQKDKIGALVFGDADIVEIRPARSRAAAMRILKSVVEMNNALSVKDGVRPIGGMLNEVLRRTVRLAKHDFLVCLVTDGFGNNRETRDLLTQIAHHNDVLVAFVYDPLEAELPDAGPLIFSDGVRQMEIDTGRRPLRESFSDEFAELRAKSARFLLQRETPVIPLSTAEEVPGQLRRLLGERLR